MSDKIENKIKIVRSMAAQKPQPQIQAACRHAGELRTELEEHDHPEVGKLSTRVDDLLALLETKPIELQLIEHELDQLNNAYIQARASPLPTPPAIAAPMMMDSHPAPTTPKDIPDPSATFVDRAPQVDSEAATVQPAEVREDSNKEPAKQRKKRSWPMILGLIGILLALLIPLSWGLWALSQDNTGWTLVSSFQVEHPVAIKKTRPIDRNRQETELLPVEPVEELPPPPPPTKVKVTRIEEPVEEPVQKAPLPKPIEEAPLPKPIEEPIVKVVFDCRVGRLVGSEVWLVVPINDQLGAVKIKKAKVGEGRLCLFTDESQVDQEISSDCFENSRVGEHQATDSCPAWTLLGLH